MPPKSFPKLTAVALLAGLALTACSPSSSSGSTHTSSPSAPSTGTGGSSTPTGEASQAPPPGLGATGNISSPAAHPSIPATGGSPVAASGQQCASAQLTIAQTDENAGAGQMGFTITFTNTSDRSCTMDGYPGVSYEAVAGKPTGAPAARSGASYHTVTLAPHGTAGATFQDANGQSGYDSGTCQLTDATGLKVYPPGERTALFLPWKTQHCTGSGVHPATIGPVTQG
ncbi:DUF4232 domain-containing protein [Kitasatospora acidiphila]|uniref:DUF4232 domain-containing protein n=1 Tax=Kitasatospora acidiphila TaxID=2567942 RepID=UPI003C724397